jgi:hypothetical protein
MHLRLKRKGKNQISNQFSITTIFKKILSLMYLLEAEHQYQVEEIASIQQCSYKWQKRLFPIHSISIVTKH